MRITLELESADIECFRSAFDRARDLVRDVDEIDIVDAAKQSLDTLCIDRLPGYVRTRLVHVQRVVLMLEDDDWSVPMPYRAEALAGLVYFSDPDDLIPDHLEVIGLIDDAIMLELLVRQLRHVLLAYRRFCAFRESMGSRAEGEITRRSVARELAECRARWMDWLHQRRTRVEAGIQQPA